LKQKKVLIISQSCSSFDAILAQAISEGKTLVVLDVEDLNPVVANVYDKLSDHNAVTRGAPE
jgi:hypothetical protein